MTSRRRRSIAAGAGAGLAGGVVSGTLLWLVPMTTQEGLRRPAMGLVAGAVHTGRVPLVWGTYLVYAALIGAAFGWVLGRQHVGGGSGVVWGVLYGGFWWIVSGLVVIPALYGVAPMTPDAVAVIRAASLPWFAAMLVDGALLGGAYVLLVRRRTPDARDDALRATRAA